VPEVIYTGELEYNHRFSDILGLTTSVYYNRISDLIDTLGATSEIDGVTYDVLQYGNVNDVVQTLGEEFEVRRSWRDGWMITFNQAWQHTREGALLDGDPITNSPAHLLALKAAMPLAGSGVSSVATRIRYESGRLTTADEWTTPALLWDLSLTGQIPAARLTYGVGVRNLLDWKVDHPGNWDYAQSKLPQPGRTLWLTSSVSF
jgi:outer membrane receptor protein involved in Fe transport